MSDGAVASGVTESANVTVDVVNVVVDDVAGVVDVEEVDGAAVVVDVAVVVGGMVVVDVVLVGGGVVVDVVVVLDAIAVAASGATISTSTVAVLVPAEFEMVESNEHSEPAPPMSSRWCTGVSESWLGRSLLPCRQCIEEGDDALLCEERARIGDDVGLARCGCPRTCAVRSPTGRRDGEPGKVDRKQMQFLAGAFAIWTEADPGAATSRSAPVPSAYWIAMSAHR